MVLHIFVFTYTWCSWFILMACFLGSCGKRQEKSNIEQALAQLLNREFATSSNLNDMLQRPSAQLGALNIARLLTQKRVLYWRDLEYCGTENDLVCYIKRSMKLARTGREDLLALGVLQ
ncbi:hypothetical protein ACTXT7_008059 [Hymenolepis weldensis]